MKSKSKNDGIEYKMQRKLVNLNKRRKKEFIDNLETINNSKSFWSICKPYFSNNFSIFFHISSCKG